MKLNTLTSGSLKKFRESQLVYRSLHFYTRLSEVVEGCHSICLCDLCSAAQHEMLTRVTRATSNTLTHLDFNSARLCSHCTDMLHQIMAIPNSSRLLLPPYPPGLSWVTNTTAACIFRPQTSMPSPLANRPTPIEVRISTGRCAGVQS